jgi:hypothetical protein
VKICFFSNDKLIKDLSKRMEGVEISIYQSLNNVKSYIDSNSDDRILLFMDLDIGEEANEVNREFLNNDKVIRILITDKVPIKKLKKHQQGKESAFGYIKKPLTPELISGIVNDFELSDYVAENDLTHEGDKVEQENVDLTFIGVKRPNLDDVVIEEEVEVKAEQVTQGHVNEFRVASPPENNSINDDFDIDINIEENNLDPDSMNDEMDLDFSLDETEEEAGAEETEAMTDEETAILSEKGVDVNATSSCFQSIANESIQEKFDNVFGVEQKSSNGPTDEDMPVDQQDENEIQSDISIDLGSFDDEVGETTEEIQAREDEEDSTSFIISPDEISLEDESLDMSKSQNEVVIEAAIVNNPELDGSPATAIINQTKKENSANLISILDEDLEFSPDSSEIPLIDVNVEGAMNDVLSIDGSAIGKPEVLVKEETEVEENEKSNGGLTKGYTEDGYMYMGGDPSDQKNWKEVKS